MFVRLRILLNIILLAIAVYCILRCELVVYGISQAAGQLNIAWNAAPVDDVISSNKTVDSVRRKLILIKEIRQFAFDSLGMRYSDNYTDYYDQHGKPLLITFSACEKLKFRQKEWTFPVLGTVSYKGYFDLRKASKEIAALRAEGYDVNAYSPSGWSTLGWFRDPVLSGMLTRNEGELADLIIHELTHGTLYVRNNVTFNENLANFIGEKGAERFLIYRFGSRSREYREFIDYNKDLRLYNIYILKSMYDLAKLYEQQMPDDEKFLQKKEIIRRIVNGVGRLPLHERKIFVHYSTKAFREGNAFFMSFVRYDSEFEKFEKELKDSYHGDLAAYLTALKRKYPSL